MKKHILALTLAAMSLTAGAAVENPNRLIIHTTTGETKVLILSDVDYLDFDEVSDVNVALAVKEGTLASDSFVITATPGSGCSSYTLGLYDGNNAMGNAYQNNAQAEISFSELEPGKTYTISAAAYDIYGIAGEISSINVTTTTAQIAPKVGDYYYSDGTWSDGGLISMDENGCNAVWAEPKPAPLPGKTVIGIVFNTNPDRISDDDKAEGYTHGYVIGCKNIQDPNKSNFAKYPESVWFAGQWGETEGNNVAKVASTCYQRINGRAESNKMFEINDSKYYSEDIPMFYYGMKEYPVTAPEGTSGWFIPAVGQMWDCVANFCNGGVAEYLASIRESRDDFSYCSKLVDEVPLDAFMKVFALVPDTDKDEMTICDEGSEGTQMIALGTSTRYDTESRVVIDLGMNGYMKFEGMCNWFDGEAHARPILAF